jgi:hypothetical protein
VDRNSVTHFQCPKSPVGYFAGLREGGLRTLAIGNPKIFEEAGFENTKAQGHIRGQVSEMFQLGLGHSVPLFSVHHEKDFFPRV